MAKNRKGSAYLQASSSFEGNTSTETRRSRGRRSWDDKLAEQFQLPLTAQQIADLGLRELRRRVAESNLTAEQKSLIHKIRRRGGAICSRRREFQRKTRWPPVIVAKGRRREFLRRRGRSRRAVGRRRPRRRKRRGGSNVDPSLSCKLASCNSHNKYLSCVSTLLCVSEGTLRDLHVDSDGRRHLKKPETTFSLARRPFIP